MGIQFVVHDTLRRHARACPGHPRLSILSVRKQDVDARVRPGHDEGVFVYVVSFYVVALRMVSLAGHHPSEERKIEDRIGLSMLMLSGVVAILISFVEPKWAMARFAVNLLDEPLRWVLGRGRVRWSGERVLLRIESIRRVSRRPNARRHEGYGFGQPALCIKVSSSASLLLRARPLQLYGTAVHSAFAASVRFQGFPGIGYWDVEGCSQV